jgi:hypothetical protein
VQLGHDLLAEQAEVGRIAEKLGLVVGELLG